ncbi:COP9 signalosome complex subunit 7 [Diplonema papillatum]|nr:COP9 signalosome complex subunit 7 [Diplonema papillatum]
MMEGPEEGRFLRLGEGGRRRRRGARGFNLAMSDLSYYVIMARNARGKGVEEVVSEALAAPSVFVFGELLDVSTVAALRENQETRRMHELLLIFTYGTYQDYREQKEMSGLPDLSAPQLHKLKQLSIVSMAAKTRSLQYDELLAALDITDVRILEDIVIDAITNKLLQAKLDQAARVVEVVDVAGRDVQISELDSMIATLSAWYKSSGQIIGTIDTLIEKGQAAGAEP